MQRGTPLAAMLPILYTLSLAHVHAAPGASTRPPTSTDRAVISAPAWEDTNEGSRPRGNLYLWSPGTVKPRRLVSGYSVFGIAADPSGRQIAFMGQDLKSKSNPRELDLWVIDIASGSVRRATSRFWGSLDTYPAWRPGTAQVVASRSTMYRDPDADVPGDGGLWCIDTATRRYRELVPPAGTDIPLHLRPHFSADGRLLASWRGGWYGVVLDMERPSRWYRLDLPQGFSTDLLMDWDWIGAGRSLALAASAATRTRCDLKGANYHSAKGPGGVWVWKIDPDAPTIAAGQTQCAGGPNSARLVAAKGETVYAVTSDPDGRRIAYLSDSGLWMHDLGTGGNSRLLRADRFPELSRMRTGDQEYNAPQMLANIRWSPSGAYLAVCTTTLRFVNIGSGQVATVNAGKAGDLFVSWLPGPR